MIVTEDAKRELRKRLGSYTSDPEIGLRLELKLPGHFRLVLDKESEGDRAIEYEGSKVLLIGRGIAGLVARWSLGVQGTAEGWKLVLLRPGHPINTSQWQNPQGNITGRAGLEATSTLRSRELVNMG